MGKEQQHSHAKVPSLGEGGTPAAALLVLNSFKSFRRLERLGYQGFCSPLVEGFTFDRWKNSPRHFCIKVETSTRRRGRIHPGKVEETTCPTGMKCALRRKKAPSQSAQGVHGRPAPSMEDGFGRGVLTVDDAFAQFGWKESPPPGSSGVLIGVEESTPLWIERWKESPPHRVLPKGGGYY